MCGSAPGVGDGCPAHQVSAPLRPIGDTGYAGRLGEGRYEVPPRDHDGWQLHTRTTLWVQAEGKLDQVFHPVAIRVRRVRADAAVGGAAKVQRPPVLQRHPHGDGEGLRRAGIHAPIGRAAVVHGRHADDRRAGGAAGREGERAILCDGGLGGLDGLFVICS